MRENLILILILRSVAKLSLETLNHDSWTEAWERSNLSLIWRVADYLFGAGPAGRERERESEGWRELEKSEDWRELERPKTKEEWRELESESEG